MFYVYILYSSSLNKYYIGYTADVNSRVYKHNAKHKGFTAGATDWQIIYTEIFNSKAEAIKREKQIKQWKSRVAIENLIRSVG